MENNRVIADNVRSFLDKTSEEYGRMKATEFADFALWLIHTDLQSPIEDLFFIAFCAQVEAERHELNPHHQRGLDGEMINGTGVFIKPQHKIGNYRADFLVYSELSAYPQLPVLVELDGHEFHDKDKTQRAYEKSRDRFLVKQGYRVVHFTGSEVVADPHKVAFEVLCLAGGNGKRKENEYDPRYPLGEF